MSRPRLALAALAPLLIAAAAVPAPVSLVQLSWMAGCWRTGNGDRIVEEQWMAPRGQVMLGMGRTTVGGATREFEQLTIYEDSAGLVFRAVPSGQAAAEFRAVELTDSSVSFANPAHDFPQRIHYRSAAGGDSLLAAVDGTINGAVRTVRFEYGRVRCSPSA